MIQFENVTMRYKNQKALDNISFTLKENVICGILGRNGAGKTSLLALLAAYRRPTMGTVKVLNEDVYENHNIMSQVAFIYDKNEENNTMKVKELLKFCATFRPNWDKKYADILCKRFDIPLKKAVSSLSKGQQAAVHVIIGLAGRTPITIYDEAYLGMDAAYRKLFVNELLEDYMKTPRTILFSTHYIDEMGSLFGEVMILDKGRIVTHEDCDTLRQKGITVIGDTLAVDKFTKGREVLSERTLGTQKERVIFGNLTQEERIAAKSDRLELQVPSLQDLFIHMTEKGGDIHEK